MTAPKAFDREVVLQELEHRWQGGYGEEAGIGWVLDELAELDVLTFKEPADDPSKDPVGTVRQSGVRVVSLVCQDGRPWVEYSTDDDYDWHTHGDVVGWPVVGVVPGTPAAEAQKPREPWTGDGSEEPPAHVKRLKWSEFDPAINGTPFLNRAGDGLWFWSYGGPEETQQDGYLSLPAMAYPGTYTEVLPE